MQKTADNMHKELLEMISSLSDGTNSDNASSVCSSASDLTNTQCYSRKLDVYNNQQLADEVQNILFLGMDIV